MNRAMERKRRKIPLAPMKIIIMIVAIVAASSCEEPNVEPQMATPESGTTTSGTTSAMTTSNLVYEETVEGPSPFSTAHDWDVGDWDYALRFVEYPRFRGVRSARFEIHKDQPLVANGKRSEITIIKTAEEGMAKEMWYSFAVMFPANGYEYDHTREIVNQWFQNGSPATSLRTKADRILLESGNELSNRKQYDIAPIVKNQWHKVVMHFIHSYGTDGLIELWYDGIKKLTIRGGNMYNDILPKWKIGLYKASFKDGTSDVSRRVVFFDNVRAGNATSTYSTMQPTL